MAEGAVFDAQAVTDAVAEGIAKIENASTMEELKAIKTQYAGAESAMTQASKAIGALPKDQKKDAGKLMGKLRADFGRAFGTKEKQVKAEEEARELAAETVDMTLPVNRKPLGARHPLPKLMEDVEDFFISMGWQISDGPEVETEWYDFDALNFGPDHPARQMQDTSTSRAIRPRTPRASSAPTWCCAPRPRPIRSVDSSPVACRCTSPARAVCSVPTNLTPLTPRCSIRWRPSPWTSI